VAHSFLVRLLVLFIGLVAIAQLATFFAAQTVTRRTIMDNAERNLHLGGEIFERLVEVRATQLRDTVKVLTDDFGFKGAVASGDAPTVQSALENHGRRIGADAGMVLDTEGRIVTAFGLRLEHERFPFPELLAHVRERGAGVATVILEGGPYQFVLVPIHAPLRIGWAGLGFEMDEALAREMQQLTGLEVSFAARTGGRYRHLVSTFSLAAGEDLLAALNDKQITSGQIDTLELHDRSFLGLSQDVGNLGGDATAILQIPMQQVMAPYRELRWQFLILTLAALLLACLGALFLARSVTRPVHVMAAAARRIGKGDYGGTVQIDERDELGELAFAFNSMQTAIAEREAKIVHQAHHDNLTGLPNRVLAHDRMNQAIERGKRLAQPAAALMLDLNRFKEINDALGHRVGDAVLKEVAKRLSREVRKTDIVARLGGDEFLIILESADHRQAYEIAEKLLGALAQTLEIGEVEVNLDASVGIAEYPEHGQDAEDLARRADIAMYEAKDDHRRIVVYQSGRDESHLRQLTLLRDLRQAVAADELEVHYQPKVSLKRGHSLAVEALVRWDHPTMGRLSPDEFVPVAEHAGNVSLITNWMLRRVIRQAGDWHRRGLGLAVSINLSAIDLLDSTLPQRVASLLEKYQLPPVQLCLEVTESAVMRDTRHGVAMLQQLKALGVRLSIDDFGTGYSSLSQLKRMPVDELKIDKSFVTNLSMNSEDAVIVRSTIEIGHNMGLKVTAEGVENRDSWHLLNEYHCDLIQGFYLSPPIALEALERWLAEFDEARYHDEETP
jgi:diguanylate cyclase (GGDEF)-like protein